MTDTETPEVTARVEENWAALEVDGETQTIRAATEEEVRHEVLRRTMQIAADTNADVNLIATDRDGEWRLVVTPQGDISETANPIRSHGAHQGTDDGGTAQSTTDSEVPDAASGSALVDDADAASTADDVPRWNDTASDPAAGRDAEPYNGLAADVSDTIRTSPKARESEATATEVPPATWLEAGESLSVDEGVPEETTVRPVGTRDVDPDLDLDLDLDLDELRAPTNPTTVNAPPSTSTISDPPPFAAAAADGEPEKSTNEFPSIWDTVQRVVPSSPPEPQRVAATPEPAADTAQEPAANPESAAETTGAPDPVEPPVTAVPEGSTDGAPTSPAAPPETREPVLPTLADFQATQPPPVAGPATQGWRGAVRRGTGGLISPAPSISEQRHREAVASVTRSLSGPRTICVINPKGGAHKTTASMLIAATFGLYRGGYTLAWDNNETRGTLGWRAHQARHANTAVNLLNDIDRFTDLRSARVGDLDNYVRTQAEAQFDVLASDEDAAASSMIDDEAFRLLHETLQRFYRIIVVDTGNNMRASNWEAAIAAADQLVIVSAIREDTAGGAAWMVEGLARKGQDAKLRDAVTILSAPDKNVDAQLRTRLTDHFGSLTRDVVEVPYDPALVSGAGISVGALAPATREAWLTATATIANGL